MKLGEESYSVVDLGSKKLNLENGNWMPLREHIEDAYLNRYKIINSQISDKNIQSYNSASAGFNKIGESYDPYKLSASSKVSDFNEPIVFILKSNPSQTTENSPNSSKTAQFSPPTRSAPLIDYLGSATLAFALIYLGRYLLKNIYKEGGNIARDEPEASLDDIKQLLTVISSENRALEYIENVRDKHELRFIRISPDLKHDIKKFFNGDDSARDNSLEIRGREDIKLLIKTTNLTPQKATEIFYNLEVFQEVFGDRLKQESKKIIEEERQREADRVRDLEIRELREMSLRKFDEINSLITRISDGRNENKLELNHGLFRQLFNQVNTAYQGLEDLLNQGRNSYDQELIRPELVQQLRDSLDTIGSELERINNQTQIQEALHVVENAVNEFLEQQNQEVGDHDENAVANPHDDEEIESEEEGEEQDVPNPNSSVETFRMHDLLILELFLLGKSYINRFSFKANGHNNQSLTFYSKGFANDLTQPNLHAIGDEFKTEDAKQKFIDFQRTKSEREGIIIPETDLNIAKNYFHNLLDRTVDNIYGREPARPNDNPNLKQDIKDGLYFFLNYAMGDGNGMLNAYREREIKNLRKSGFTGLGHASGANIEDLKKLCYCLKLFEDNLKQVNSNELSNFFNDVFFLSTQPRQPLIITSNTREEISKSDETFVKDIVKELILPDGDKIRGIKDAKELMINFIRSNFNDEFRSQHFEITTLTDDDLLERLNQNPDLIDKIVINSRTEESNNKFDNFKQDLKSLYEKKRQENN